MQEVSIEAGICQCGCGEPTRIIDRTDSARGYVRGEYRRFVFGHAAIARSRAEGERFWARVEVTPSCWLWLGTRDDRGYGLFCPSSIDRRGPKKVRAHRFAYEAKVGPIPEGLVLDHLCRVRNCVNPAHLEPVTDRENRCRGLSSPTKTVCIHGHAYTPENTVVYNGKRNCRTCRNIAARRRYAERVQS